MWQKKLEHLRGSEAEFSEKSRRTEQEGEARAYQQRQRMLEEMEGVRRRDAQSRKEAEDAQLHVQKQEARVRELEALVERKVAEVERARLDNARHAESELARAKGELHAAHEAEQRAAAGARRQLEEQLLQALLARDTFGDALAEARVAREEGVVLHSEVARLASALQAAKETARRAQERTAEVADELREQATQADRARARLVELEAEAGGRAPLSSADVSVADQVAELRASHSRERVLKEKQVIDLQAEIKAAQREALAVRHRLDQLQHDHDSLASRYLPPPPAAPSSFLPAQPPPPYPPSVQ